MFMLTLHYNRVSARAVQFHTSSPSNNKKKSSFVCCVWLNNKEKSKTEDSVCNSWTRIGWKTGHTVHEISYQFVFLAHLVCRVWRGTGGTHAAHADELAFPVFVQFLKIKAGQQTLKILNAWYRSTGQLKRKLRAERHYRKRKQCQGGHSSCFSRN